MFAQFIQYYQVVSRSHGEIFGIILDAHLWFFMIFKMSFLVVSDGRRVVMDYMKCINLEENALHFIHIQEEVLQVDYVMLISDDCV